MKFKTIHKSGKTNVDSVFSGSSIQSVINFIIDNDNLWLSSLDKSVTKIFVEIGQVERAEDGKMIYISVISPNSLITLTEDGRTFHGKELKNCER